jgi:hypothetical protein
MTETAEVDAPEIDPVTAALLAVADNFGAVCHDPDNAEVCAAADRSLHDLDALLAGAAG